MKTKITFLLIFLFQFAFAQVDYGTPSIESLPEKLKSLKVEIEVMHFPKENDPFKSDTVPLEVPFSTILAPMIGSKVFFTRILPDTLI